jgi:peptide/nickel transport system permease protein
MTARVEVSRRAITKDLFDQPGIPGSHVGAALVGAAFFVVAAVVVMAIGGQLLAPKDAYAPHLLSALRSPSSDYLLGTDGLGRDVLSRVIVGARTGVAGPALVAIAAMLVGSLVGLTSGYRGGWLDTLIMRVVDIVYSLPGVLVAVVVVGVLGGGYLLSCAVLTLTFAPSDIRIVRGLTLEQRALPYVEAARSLGVSRNRIMFFHIWPNCLPVIVANVFLNFAFAIVALSALSFLGLGVDPSTPDWGRMLSDGRTHLFDNPLIALGPGVMIVLTAASMKLIGDWAYEELAQRGRAR